jgi:hypothetical protein
MVAYWVGTSSISHAQSANGSARWSERGMFAFGFLVADFGLGQEQGVQRGRQNLQDCSTEEYFCADGSFFSLVLPRQCVALNEGSWSVGDIRSELLGRWSSVSEHSWDEYYFIGSPRQPKAVFAYRLGSGITSIYVDVTGERDFAEMARSGALARALDSRGSDRQNIDRYSYGLSTFDRMGICVDPEAAIADEAAAQLSN